MKVNFAFYIQFSPYSEDIITQSDGTKVSPMQRVGVACGSAKVLNDVARDVA